MTILGGQFAIMMLVTVDDTADTGVLEAELDLVRERLGLDAVMVREVDERSAAARPEPTNVLTVYGVDHPGIVHAVCAALAEHGVNIDDLATRVGGDDDDAPAIYTLICELTLPPAVTAEQLASALGEVGRAQGVEVALRPLDHDVL